MPTSPSQIDSRWPSGELVEDVIAVLIKKLELGENLALITLIDRVGATPRKIGSQMLVDKTGNYWGHVSGGCVESNLVLIAQEVISNNTTQFISLGEGGDFVDISLPCGSRIDLVIEAITPNSQALSNLCVAQASRGQALWGKEGMQDAICTIDAIEDKAAGRSGHRYWWQYTPPLRLIIHGHDAVTLALVKLAQQMRWDIILNGGIGHDTPPSDFNGTYLSHSCDALFDAYTPDLYTAIVSLKHDIEEDHQLLKFALPSKAFYVGVLGSRQHLNERKALLEAENIRHARLSGPVGLNIGAATPYEIAVSILAEIIDKKSG